MTESTQKPGETKSARWWIVLSGGATFLIVIAVWFLYPTLAPKLMQAQSSNELTAMFGGLDALFAGLAFAGVIVAILLQMEELRQTREEMERSANALTEQVQLMVRTAEITERTAKIMSSQTDEMQRATHAAAFKSVFDILQDEEVRQARRIVIKQLSHGKYQGNWQLAHEQAAEKVIYTYDAVGVMIRSGMLPSKIVIDHWGNSIRRCWDALKEFVAYERETRKAPELFDDFEWLADQANVKD